VIYKGVDCSGVGKGWRERGKRGKGIGGIVRVSWRLHLVQLFVIYTSDRNISIFEEINRSISSNPSCGIRGGQAPVVRTGILTQRKTS